MDAIYNYIETNLVIAVQLYNLIRLHALAAFVFIDDDIFNRHEFAKAKADELKSCCIYASQVDGRLRVLRDDEVNRQGTQLNPTYILNEKFIAHLM